MTICVSIICEEENAIIVGADRMITDHGIPIEFESSTTKYSQFWTDELGFIFASAGSALTPDRIDSKIKTDVEEYNSIMEIVEDTKDIYIDMKRTKFEEEILEQRGLTLDEFYQSDLRDSSIGRNWDQIYGEFNLSLDIILAGVDSSGPHTYRISDTDEYNGLVESFAGLGFDAVGTGASLARDILTSRFSRDLTIDEGLYVMYTALNNASQAPGVGKNFDMTVIRANEAPKQIEQETITQLEKIYYDNEEAVPIPDLAKDFQEKSSND